MAEEFAGQSSSSQGEQPHEEQKTEANGRDAGQGTHTNGHDTPLAPDFGEVERHLKAVNLFDCLIHVTAMKFTDRFGYREGQAFKPFKSFEKFRKWMTVDQSAHQGWNFYVHVNEPDPAVPVDEKKLGEDQIEMLRNVVADIDVKVAGATARAEVLKKIVAKVLEEVDDPWRRSRPSLIVMTGNGVHIWFTLKEPVSATKENVQAIKRAGVGLQERFRECLPADEVKIDAVHNIDRIMRIAGSINYPTARKLAAGAKPCAARIIHEDAAAKVTIEQLREEFPNDGPVNQPGVTDARIKEIMEEMDTEMFANALVGDINSLPEALRTKLEEALASDAGFREFWRDGTGKSGSENSFALAGRLRRLSVCGERFTAAEYAALAAVWQHSYGENADNNVSPRSFARSWAKTESETAESVFDDGVEPDEGQAAKAAGGRSSHPNWKKFDALLIELREARDEIRVNNMDVEVFDSQTQDPSEMFDDPFVTNRHTRGEVTMMTAPPERGKSLMMVLTAMAVAHEKPELLTSGYAGDPTEVTDWAGGVALALNESGGRAGRMLKAVEEVNGLKRSDQKHPIHIYSERLVVAELVDRKVVPTGSMLSFLRWLIELRKKGEIALVVIDTLASATSGLAENATEAMQPVMDMMADIAMAGFCAVEVTHHPAKTSSATVDAYQGRGAGAIGGAVFNTATMERVEEDDPTRLRLVLGKRRNGARVGTKEEFDVGVRSFKVTRARAPGQTRMATAPALKRKTAEEAAADRAKREDDSLREAVYALDIAMKAGIEIRPGGNNRGGPKWKSAWAVVQDNHRGVTGKAMTTARAKEIIATLEAKRALKRVVGDRKETFELAPEWAERANGS